MEARAIERGRVRCFLARPWVAIYRVLTVGGVILLAACATTWHKPEVSLADVRLVGGDFLQQKVKLQLRIRNTNTMEIGVESVRFDLLVGEGPFASGRSMAPVTIPRQGDALLELEANTQVLALLGRLPNLVDSEGKIHYRLKGEALIRGYGRTPFDQVGILDLGKLQGLGATRREHVPKAPLAH